MAIIKAIIRAFPVSADVLVNLQSMHLSLTRRIYAHVVKARASGHDPLVLRWYTHATYVSVDSAVDVDRRFCLRQGKGPVNARPAVCDTRRSRRRFRSLHPINQLETKKVAEGGMGQEPRPGQTAPT